jgi:hypothetical protein
LQQARLQNGLGVHKEKQPKMRVARQFLVMYGFDKLVSFDKQ